MIQKYAAATFTALAILLSLLSRSSYRQIAPLLLLLHTCTLLSAAPLQAQEQLSIVATTSIIADSARAIAGPFAQVSALMGPGVDPHLYKASPGDLRTLQNASLILYNGLHLEGKIADALKKLGSRKPVVAVAERIAKEKLRRVSSDGDQYDPHVWFDVRLWIECAESIRDAISTHDPLHAAEYSKRFVALRDSLQGLDKWVHTQVAAIPLQHRVLITAHDAFGYFGRAYNIEVLAIQGVSTDSEASLRSVNELVQIIVKRKIPAIFIENTLSPKAVEALAQGAKASGHTVIIGGELLGDSLGPVGSPTESYIGTVQHNVRTITTALSGATQRSQQ